MKERSSKNILIMSTCPVDWGGSEELWSRTVPHLLDMGFKVIVYKKYINRLHKEFSRLANKGVILTDHWSSFSRTGRLFNRGVKFVDLVYTRVRRLAPRKEADKAFAGNLKRFRPELAVISQGINFDGLSYAYQCLLMDIPYVIICHKAVDFYWPDAGDREYMTRTFRHAKRVLFVSRHNLRLTEEQFGTRLPNGEVIFNPVKWPSRAIPYPPAGKGYRLACVGRMFLLDKGQDILLRILSKDKWKDRPVSVSFIGSGDNYGPLQEMAALLGVKNVHFTGQVSDMESIWSEHHALIMPSRSEGLALTVVEAMAAGRPVIVTNAGGNAELVEEGITGFIGKTEQDSFEDAMERGWNNRTLWESMGRAAKSCIARTIPGNPESEFANLLNKVVND